MKKTLFTAALATLAILGLSQQGAQASTMPKAEANTSSVVIGLGPSVSFDAVLAPRMTLGASLGLPFLVEGTNRVTGRYDVRLAYKFLQEGPFSLAGIFGVWGNVRFDNPSVSRWIGLELGVGMSYRFTPQLTGRLNIVPGFSFPFPGAGIADFYPPAGGFELAYQFNPNFEGTLGYNGQGDILGLRFLI
ncbi:MAG: hypothetical protein ACO1RX_01980 [Candidatus Sericytochromatia bacterium]